MIFFSSFSAFCFSTTSSACIPFARANQRVRWDFFSPFFLVLYSSVSRVSRFAQCDCQDWTAQNRNINMRSEKDRDISVNSITWLQQKQRWAQKGDWKIIDLNSRKKEPEHDKDDDRPIDRTNANGQNEKTTMFTASSQWLLYGLRSFLSSQTWTHAHSRTQRDHRLMRTRCIQQWENTEKKIRRVNKILCAWIFGRPHHRWNECHL